MEIEYFVQRVEYLEKEIASLERKVKKYPKGRLTCVHNGKYKKWYVSKRQIMRQSLKSTPPVKGDVASGIRPEDYLTTA